MGECKGGAGDCQIKLFGKTIPVPEAGDATVRSLLFCSSRHFISPLSWLIGFMLRSWLEWGTKSITDSLQDWLIGFMLLSRS
jgi:hypothetical protein